MGWIAESAYEHEGWVANVLVDGREASASTRDGVVLHTPPTAADEAAGYVRRPYPDAEATDVVVPWDQVVTWRATCECGWRGPELPAVTDEHGWRDCPEDLADREFYPAWKDHVAPFTALAELGELSERLRALEADVGEKVRLARLAGASWSQIGREVGLTKQGAQQRWASTLEQAGG